MNVSRCVFVFMVALTATAGSAFADSDEPVIQGPRKTIGPGETVDLTFSPTDGSGIGVRYENLTGDPGTLSIDFRGGPALLSDQKVEGGFKLLDGTFNVTSTIAGEKRVRYRMRYRERRLRRLGLRASSVRLMRLNVDERIKTWVPAYRQIRETDARLVDVRRLRKRHADFTLGHYGFTREGGYAWAVVDVNSDYALGALPVPEPASWLMILTGGGLLLSRLSRRRRRAVRV